MAMINIRGLLAMALGQWTESIGFWNNLLTVNASNSIALNNIAICLFYQGKGAEVKRLIQNLPRRSHI
jgi:hypothetical protein